jgi:WD repeat-containing protein 35
VYPTCATQCIFYLQDVWDLCWAEDNPELLAIMEKGRMYVLRGMDPEEPVNSSACLAEFKDLQVCCSGTINSTWVAY